MKSTCLPRILSCCLVLLSGCASVEVQRERALAALRSAESAMAAQPVSSGFDDPRAVAGQLRKGLHNLALGPSRPVTDIHGGRAYFAVLELPAFISPYQIEVFPKNQTLAVNLATQVVTFATIWPALTLLDADHQVLASLMPRYRNEQDRYLTASGIFGYISICDARPRYVVVHGLPGTYGRINHSGATTYSQYGSSSTYFDLVQLPQGEIGIGLPTKPVGKTIFGGDAERPCEPADQSVQDFLKLRTE